MHKNLFSHYFAYNESLARQGRYADCKRKLENYGFLCGIYSLFFLVLITVGISAGGIYVGYHYNNETCYVTKNIIALSNYLLFTNVTNIMIWAVMLTLAVISSHSDIQHTLNASFIIFAGVALGSIIYSITMVIIGILELINQFQPCINDIENVCVMTIITVIINGFYVLGLCIKWKCSYNSDYEEL